LTKQNPNQGYFSYFADGHKINRKNLDFSKSVSGNFSSWFHFIFFKTNLSFYQPKNSWEYALFYRFARHRPKIYTCNINRWDKYPRKKMKKKKTRIFRGISGKGILSKFVDPIFCTNLVIRSIVFAKNFFQKCHVVCIFQKTNFGNFQVE